MNPGTVLNIAPWGRSGVVLLLGVLLLGACRGGGGAAGLSPADEAGVRRVDSLFAAAVNAGDIAGVARTYGPDAWLFPPEAPPVRGRDGIRGFWAGFLRSYDVHLTVGADRVEGRGDLAYVAGHYRLETRPKSPEVPVLAPEDGKFLEVLKRGSDGSWSYAMDMYSADAPAK
jgi:ketosteroid isomerase-like protein